MPLRGGLGRALDMSRAARMRRAKELGFVDDVYYHGTADDIRAFDPAKRGTTTGARSAKMGFFLTKDPKTAAGYADMANDAKAQKLYEDYSRSSGPERQAKYKYWQEHRFDTSDNIIPARVRYKNPYIWDAQGQEYDAALGEGGLGEVIQKAQDAGHDAVIIRNFNDDPFRGGKAADHVVVFEPSNIRSIHAAFDPEKSAGPDLLGQIDPELLKWVAGMTAAGVGASKARQSGLGDAVATVGSGLVGGLVGDLSRLGGYLNPFVGVDQTEAGARALEQRLQYTPSAPNPYLNRLGEEVEQFEKDLSPLTDAVKRSIPYQMYQRLPARIRGLGGVIADWAL